MHSFEGLPNFFLYMAVSVALLALFVIVYIRCTAHDELALIRAGNLSAAVALAGSMLGFVIPLAKAVAQAASIPDMLVWGVAAFIVQILAYLLIRVLVPDLSAKIAANTLASGTLLASASIASGILNAAAMTV